MPAKGPSKYAKPVCYQENDADITQEAHERRLDLSKEDLKAVTEVIRFMYTRAECAPRGLPTELAAIFSLAVRFDMEDLQFLVHVYFKAIMEIEWKDAKLFQAEELVALIHIVYSTIPMKESTDLRKALASVVALQAASLLEDHCEILEAAFEMSGAFAADVFRAGQGWEIA
jgi:hypothetical protein